LENAVVEAALDTLRTHRPQLLHFGVSDDSAWQVGLACGGSIGIFVQSLDRSLFESLRAAWVDDRTTIAATLIRAPQETVGKVILVRDGAVLNGPFDTRWERPVLALASEAASRRISQRVSLDESVEVFLERIEPSPTLIVVGGVHIAVALVPLAKALGYRTVIVDPRQAWGNAERFPDVDELVRSWPDDAFRHIPLTHSSAVVMLTHDPKLDDPALKAALASPAFYVGALGSRSAQLARRERLLKGGLSETQLARLHAPIGLDIGAGSPGEIALAIMAQVVEAYRKPRSTRTVADVNMPASA
jgi:xanthine dehydrogenase accessory factor